MQALRQDRRTFLPYDHFLGDRYRRVHYLYLHYECRSSLHLAVSLSANVRVCRSNNATSRFLMAQQYAGFVVMYTWISNSFPRPPSKRAVAVALVNAFAQIGNVAGS